MKVAVFKIYQFSIIKYADIELQNGHIVWMNTNIDKGGVMKVGEMPGDCYYSFVIKEVAFSETNTLSGKVTHLISIPKERKNLYLNLNPKQLLELYPEEVTKPNYDKILTLFFLGVSTLIAVLMWLKP